MKVADEQFRVVPYSKSNKPEMASAANIYVYTDLKKVFTDSDEFCT
jgi:hypothetical protein